ncbi:hypothetical protein ACJMK2_021969 [Sinanodonta woodiana]|uniref:TIR domain-containing protein n=1 Tax=Sinanodonta woodiana TaxID=1069815 RepID=A0ABD3TJG8_SINWO
MTDNPYPQLTERISNLPLEILRVTTRRKIAKYLDCGDADQESKGYINLARLAEFSDSNILVFSQEKSPTEALLAEWQLRKPTVGTLFECLQFLGRDDVIKDCIKCVENDAISFLSGLPDGNSRLNLTPTGGRKTTSKATLKGSEEIESKKQAPDLEKTLPLDVEDSAAFDKFLFDDPTKIATVHDLRNPGEEQIRYDAFVSVNFDSKKDLEFVKEMAEVLEKKFNMKLFIPFRDSIPGSAEHSMSAYLIDVRCNKVLVILSKSFLKCSACDFQLKFAQCLHPSVRTKKIIPVMIEPGTPIPLILRFVTVCDFTQTEMAEWVLERLICALRAPIPAIEIGEEDPSDNYTTDTSMHELKLELKMAVFNEVFKVKVDEDQTNTESARDSHNASSLTQSQNSSSSELNEKPKENKKSLFGSFFSKLSTRIKKKKEKEQNEEEEFNRIAKKLAALTTQKDLINGKDAKTTSENKKHGLSISGEANDVSESQTARNINCNQKAPLTDPDGDAALNNLQETMPFHLNPNDHIIDSSHGSLSSRKDSVTDSQDVQCKDKTQQNMTNCEEDLNIAALGQIHCHNSSRQSPAGYLTHKTVDTKGRGDTNNRPVTKSEVPIHMTSDQKMHSPSLKRSNNIPVSQGFDEYTAHFAQLYDSHTNDKHGCYQLGTNHTSFAKEQGKDRQLRSIQCANKHAILEKTDEENAHLGTSVNATGATVLQRLETKASGNENCNWDRADPVFV